MSNIDDEGLSTSRSHSTATPLPVFLQPTEINFVVSKPETHKQVLTCYNPYDFPLRFTVLSNAPSKYRVVEPRGFIRPKCYVDMYVHPMAARHGYDDFDDLPSHASSSETSFNSAASSAGSGDARPCFVVDALERRIRIVGCDEQKRRSEQLYLLEELSPELYADYGREVEVPDEDADNYTDCAVCDRYFTLSCLEHPLYRAPDRPVSQMLDPSERAIKTLPHFLKILESSIPKAGRGVFACTALPVGIVFGPYEGILKEDKKSVSQQGYAWEMRGSVRGQRFYIDGLDEKYGNWMRFINSSRWEAEQNLLAFQYCGSVYYKVYKPIDVKTELLVYYGENYKLDGVNKPKERVLLWKERFSATNRNPYVL